jgi:hypothetical protein
MTRLLSRVIIFLSILFMSAEAVVLHADSSRSTSAQLLETAKDFMTNWLIKRDYKTAKAYISSDPILGICALPQNLSDNKMISSHDYKQAIEWMLKTISEEAPVSDSLDKIVERLEITPSEDQDIAKNEPFELFSIKQDYKTATMICKFDQNPHFRKAFKSPDVWYMYFRIKHPKRRDFSWVIAWEKEREEWRILSIGPLED